MSEQEPRKAPIGQHAVRMGTAEGVAERIAELRAQARWFSACDPAESQRMAAEADRLEGIA